MDIEAVLPYSLCSLFPLIGCTARDRPWVATLQRRLWWKNEPKKSRLSKTPTNTKRIFSILCR